MYFYPSIASPFNFPKSIAATDGSTVLKCLVVLNDGSIIVGGFT